MPKETKHRKIERPKVRDRWADGPFGSLVFGVLILATGCSGGAGLAPISGRVTLDDKPVPNMIVNFTPLGDTAGNGALGHTDADGRYTLLDARGEAGAYVGEYKVSFYPGVGRTKDTDPRLDVVSAPSKGGLPAIYLDPIKRRCGPRFRRAAGRSNCY